MTARASGWLSRPSPAERARRAAGFLVWLSAGVLVLTAFLSLGIWTVDQELGVSKIRAEEGHAYLIRLRRPLPLVRLYGDDGLPAVSSQVLEDGVSLGSSGVEHAVIRNVGRGAFSHWKGHLYFSTSDNSDPRTNGRRYVLRADATVDPGLVSVAALLGLAGLGFRRISQLVDERGWSAVRARLGTLRAAPAASADGVVPAAWLGGAALCATVLFIAWLAWGREVGPRVAGMLRAPAIGSLLLVIGGTLMVVPRRGMRSRILVVLLALSGTCIAITVFAEPVFSAWSTGRSSGYYAAGLVPENDADGYYIGGLQLLNDGTLGEWNMRRPLNASLQAFTLHLFDGDLRLDIAARALALALLSALAALEIARSFGIGAGLVFMAFCCGFSAPFLPSTLTAVHGVLYGVCAVLILVRAATDESLVLFGLGVAVAGLGLNARSGAFFLLPALLLWGAVVFRHRRWSLPAIGAWVAGVSVAFAIPWAFNHFWGEGANLAQSNFAYTLYGMAAGGKGWAQIYTDHPEVFQSGGEGVQARRMYALAFELLRANPLPFIGFYLRELTGFFGFTGTIVSAAGNLIKEIFAFAVVVGCVGAVVYRRAPVASLIVFSMLGIWASSPFIMMDGGARVFASVFPFLALTAAAGVYWAARCILVVVASASPGDGWGAYARGGMSRAVIGWLGLFIVAGTALGPAYAVAVHQRAEVPLHACPDGQQAVVSAIPRSLTVVEFVAEGTAPTYAPTVRASDFAAGLGPSTLPVSRALAERSPPFTLLHGYDLDWRRHVRPQSFWAVLPGSASQLPREGMVLLCGRPDPTPEMKGWVQYFYDVDSVSRLGAP